jgi:hypothetical protein
MIGFIGTSLQLQSIITAHNQWLSTTRSIPCWTTSVFSSTVTSDEQRISPEWILLRVLMCSPFITLGEPNREHHIVQLSFCYNLCFVLCYGTCLAIQQRRSYCWLRNPRNVLTESLSSDVNIRHNIGIKLNETLLEGIKVAGIWEVFSLLTSLLLFNDDFSVICVCWQMERILHFQLQELNGLLYKWYFNTRVFFYSGMWGQKKL